MTTGANADAKNARDQFAVRVWLFALAFLVFCMVVLGGATRLTGSGLSITEWRPVMGVLPPLDATEWQEAFDKYRQIPEYRLVNAGMSLEAFKTIYWWEWSHRLFGRVIGLAFIVPFAVFWMTGRLSRRDIPVLVCLFVLGGLQGLLGWYMVMSGLSQNTDVSQYRLTAHLTLAAVIFAALIWVALAIGRPRRWPEVFACVLVGAVLLQIAFGGLAAGLNAGLSYNTWPLMVDRLIPHNLDVLTPWWLNMFENVTMVQFQHRIMAYVLVVLAALELWRRPRGASALTLAVLVLAQTMLGIWTLLGEAPFWRALGHQALAIVVLAAAVWHASAQTRNPG